MKTEILLRLLLAVAAAVCGAAAVIAVERSPKIITVLQRGFSGNGGDLQHDFLLVPLYL